MNRKTVTLHRSFVGPAIVGGVLLAVFISMGVIFHSFALVGSGLLFLLGLFLLWCVLGRPLSGVLLLGVICIAVGVAAMRAPLREVASDMENGRYLRSLHASIEEIASITDRHGDRYVVYDQEKGQLLSTCLPEEYRARSLDELAGVFTVETGAWESGFYSGKDRAYTVKQTITLRSAMDGAELGQGTVYGGKPPEFITVDVIWDIFRFWNTKHYGSRPTETQVREACLEILKANGVQSDQ